MTTRLDAEDCQMVYAALEVTIQSLDRPEPGAEETLARLMDVFRGPCTAEVRTRVDDYADKVMVMIHHDQTEGFNCERLPAYLTSFTELHDYCDANMYVIAALGKDFVTVEHYGDEDAHGNRLDDATLAAIEAETNMANAVMDEVSRRMAADPLGCCGRSYPDLEALDAHLHVDHHHPEGPDGHPEEIA